MACRQSSFYRLKQNQFNAVPLRRDSSPLSGFGLVLLCTTYLLVAASPSEGLEQHAQRRHAGINS
jgi:hypothetical protein